MSGGFHCDRCGICCRKVGKFPFMKEFDRGDGTCRHLTDKNLCAIYDSRPEVCNVDALYERLYAGKISREEFYRINERACEALKKGG